MSLLVWLPLNGTIENKGLDASFNTIKSGTPTYAESGKISSKCLTVNSTSDALHYANDLNLTKSISICVWLKTTSTDTSESRYIIWDGSDNNKSGFGLRFQYGSYTTLMAMAYGTYITTNLPINEWHHITMTMNKETLLLSLFKDGEFINSINYEESTIHADGKFNIGFLRPDYYPFLGCINDVRVYDHCLSPKEVKEISKALVLHYPLNDTWLESTTIVYDCSGYGNNGTIYHMKLYEYDDATDTDIVTDLGQLTLDSDTPRYDKCTVFDGNSYIAAGKGAKVTDAITVSLWGYMTSWNNYSYRLISCTNSGGWNFERLNKYYLSFSLAYLNSSGSNAYLTISKESPFNIELLSPGWHMFTGTFDGINKCLYIDGIKKETVSLSSKTPINYWDANGIMVGTEADYDEISFEKSSFNFVGKMSDVRIYATALSADDIKELYDTAAFITDNGTVESYLFEEDDNNQINKSGIWENQHFTQLGNHIKVLEDGSVWLQILHHNNPAENLFTKTNCSCNDDENLWSRLNILEVLSQDIYEFYVEELITNSSVVNTCRWSLTSNPSLSSTLSGYKLISNTSSSTQSFGLMNKNTYAYMHNGSTWWCACGSYTAFSGGIPGFTGTVTTGYLDLYIRLNDLSLLGVEDSALIYESITHSNQLIEI